MSVCNICSATFDWCQMRVRFQCISGHSAVETYANDSVVSMEIRPSRVIDARNIARAELGELQCKHFLCPRIFRWQLLRFSWEPFEQVLERHFHHSPGRSDGGHEMFPHPFQIQLSVAQLHIDMKRVLTYKVKIEHSLSDDFYFMDSFWRVVLASCIELTARNVYEMSIS